MLSCPSCEQPASKRNGRDRRGRQKYACGACRSTFTEDSVSAFSGYRWPADVILTAVRWYLAYPLSSRQVLELLAERGIDVWHRTVLNWVQAFGPQLANEVRRRRRPVGKHWFVDMVCTQDSTLAVLGSIGCRFHESVEQRSRGIGRSRSGDQGWP